MTEENVEIVRQKVLGDHRLTVRMIANELDMNCERVWLLWLCHYETPRDEEDLCQNGSQVVQ